MHKLNTTIPDNLPRHRHVMFPQSLRVVCWTNVRLIVDRDVVANALIVFDSVNSAILVLALFN